MIKRKTPLRRKSTIKRVSDKRRVEQNIYSERRRLKLAKFFLCQVDLAEKGFNPHIPPVLLDDLVFVTSYHVDNGCSCVHSFPLSHFRLSTEIHHAARRGKNYLNEDSWWAISRHFHDAIGQRPSWARARGYLTT